MNTEQITVVDNQIVDNTVVDNTVVDNQIVDNTVLQGGVIGELRSPKKPVLKAIPKKIMGYLKFAHFVLTTANNDDTILTKLFLDKSIEQIVSIVNDVVENGTQDKDINDLRKQLINSAKPKKTRAKNTNTKTKTKTKNIDDADAIVTDLVTLARTSESTPVLESIPKPPPKPRTKKSKNVSTPVQSVVESTVQSTVESTVQSTVESTVQSTPESTVQSTPESTVQSTPESTPKPKPTPKPRTKKPNTVSLSTL